MEDQLPQIALLGADWVTFILFSCGLMGFLAFMTGNGLAKTWKPAWQVIPYALLLAVAQRFLVFALFSGNLLSISGYAVGSLVMLLIAGGAYRMTVAHQMVVQYPWLNERTGLFGWRQKPQS